MCYTLDICIHTHRERYMYILEYILGDMEKQHHHGLKVSLLHSLHVARYTWPLGAALLRCVTLNMKVLDFSASQVLWLKWDSWHMLSPAVVCASVSTCHILQATVFVKQTSNLENLYAYVICINTSDV